jgi:hypothetical protein
MDGRMAGGKGWIEEQMDECVNEQMDGSMNVGRGWMDKWKGWLDGLMGGWVWGYHIRMLLDFTFQTEKKSYNKKPSLDKLEIKSKSKYRTLQNIMHVTS